MLKLFSERSQEPRYRRVVQFLTPVLDRHCALNHTFVIQGKHRLFHADGELKEVRPVGSYAISPADPAPHCECGGDEWTIVFFGIRGTRGPMYEILDDEQNLLATFNMAGFETLYQLQQRG